MTCNKIKSELIYEVNNISHGSKGYFVIESDQKIIELRNQELNTLTKKLLKKLYELGFSDAEIFKLFDKIGA